MFFFPCKERHPDRARDMGGGRAAGRVQRERKETMRETGIYSTRARRVNRYEPWLLCYGTHDAR